MKSNNFSKIIVEITNVVISTFKENENKINNLNVFPVPDGDTGTNMLLTLKSIQQELLNTKNIDLKTAADKISYGALMGARGNSGVILSQILKGFFDIIVKEENLRFDTIKLAAKSAMELAYSSVQNPTEGTILTTIKDIYKTLQSLDGNIPNNNSINYLKLLDKIIDETEKSVLRTTFLLPVLKQAGVVDAGAQGLLVILIGLKKALNQLLYSKSNVKKFNDSNSKTKTKIESIKEDELRTEKEIEKIKDNTSNINLEDVKKDAIKHFLKAEEIDETLSLKKIDFISEIKNIYCTELVIKGENINILKLREDIESFGDSALVVGNPKLVKIHVHTNFPQKVLHRALKEGTIHDIQINNMIDQSKQAASLEIVEPIEKIEKQIGIIAIANGDGFEEIFKSLGVDYVIKGGQSMNPSTYDIVKAINKLDSENIILLPNNKNIILTANQAKKIVKKNIIVIPSITIPQGISAALMLNLDLTIEENIENMNKAIKAIKTGEVTRAIRDANLYVGEIKKGAYIGLADGNIKVISDNLFDCVLDLFRDIFSGNEEIATFYFGSEVDLAINEEIQKAIKKGFPNIEVEFHNGGQPLYPYIFSLE